jgi:hypothetical protein
MCPILNGFRDRRTSLSSYKVVDKEILCIVSNIGIYCSSNNVGKLYLVQYIFENSTVNFSSGTTIAKPVSAYSAFVKTCDSFTALSHASYSGAVRRE